jgi:hypothetical protein
MPKGQELNLSFLDTIACSFGGMILLFVMLSLLPQEGIETDSDSEPEPDRLAWGQTATISAPSAGGGSLSPVLFALKPRQEKTGLSLSAENNSDASVVQRDGANSYLVFLLQSAEHPAVMKIQVTPQVPGPIVIAVERLNSGLGAAEKQPPEITIRPPDNGLQYSEGQWSPCRVTSSRGGGAP